MNYELVRNTRHIRHIYCEMNQIRKSRPDAILTRALDETLLNLGSTRPSSA
jgi:hypothetical protein